MEKISHQGTLNHRQKLLCCPELGGYVYSYVFFDNVLCEYSAYTAEFAANLATTASERLKNVSLQNNDKMVGVK